MVPSVMLLQRLSLKTEPAGSRPVAHTSIPCTSSCSHHFPFYKTEKTRFSKQSTCSFIKSYRLRMSDISGVLPRSSRLQSFPFVVSVSSLLLPNVMVIICYDGSSIPLLALFPHHRTRTCLHSENLLEQKKPIWRHKGCPVR